MNLSGSVAAFERSPDWLHNCIVRYENGRCVAAHPPQILPWLLTTPPARTDEQDSGQGQGHVDEELCKSGEQGRVTRRCICDSVEQDHGDNI